MKISSAVVVAIFVAFASSLHAQFITWSGPTAIMSDSDVQVNGSYVDAFQGAQAGFNGKDGIVETVNGAAFNPNAGTFSDGVISISASGGVDNGTDGNDFGSGVSATFAAALADCAFSGSGTVTLSGLNPADEYQVQIFNATPYDPTVYVGSTAGDSIEATAGTYVLGTFTPGAATESFTFVQPSTGGTGASVISAISLRDLSEVPEPSTYAMIGLGLLSLLAFGQLRRLVL